MFIERGASRYAGLVGACFLCNTGRLKLKGAKLKDDCNTVSRVRERKAVCVRVVTKERRREEGKDEETKIHGDECAGENARETELGEKARRTECGRDRENELT